MNQAKHHAQIIKKAEEALALHPNCSYIIQPELGDMSKDKVHSFCYRLKELLLQKFPNESFIIVPVHNGVGKIDILELESEVIQYDQN